MSCSLDLREVGLVRHMTLGLVGRSLRIGCWGMVDQQGEDKWWPSRELEARVDLQWEAKEDLLWYLGVSRWVAHLGCQVEGE